MKRVIVFLLVLVLLIGSFSFTAYAGYSTLKKGNSGSSVRQMQNALISLGYSLAADGKYGPATEAVVRQFQRDHSLSADGIAGNKTLTRLYDLSSTIVSPSAAPVISPTSVPSGQDAHVKTSGGRLNLRSGPSNSSGIICTIPNGASVVCLSSSGSWTAVRYNGQIGFVSSSYIAINTSVQKQPAASPSPTVTPSPTPFPVQPPVYPDSAARVSTNGGTLNLRASASTSSKILRSIPNGTAVTVVSTSGGWSKISYNGSTGYVNNAYITLSSVSPSPAPVITAEPVPTASPSVPSYDVSVFTRTLRSGYTGKDVTLLQERLSELNYLSSVSGSYDTKTINAVRDFQTAHGLKVDGLAGKDTFSHLFSKTALPYTASNASLSTLHIYYRNESSQDTAAITRMQKALLDLGYPVSVSGSFDEKTYIAVLEFELRNGIAITGAATVQMQSCLYSGTAKPFSSPASVTVSDNEGRIEGPATEELRLLHWFNTVKPSLRSGDKLLVFDPATHLSWNLLVYSCGNHCDSQPASLKDTLIMNKAFGTPSWTVRTVYVRLPDGAWTMAATHNRPHLTASVTDNGFDGHLCVHFLRDLSEVKKNDPDYGLSNQLAIRSAWEKLTGMKVD